MDRLDLGVKCSLEIRSEVDDELKDLLQNKVKEFSEELKKVINSEVVDYYEKNYPDSVSLGFFSDTRAIVNDEEVSRVFDSSENLDHLPQEVQDALKEINSEKEILKRLNGLRPKGRLKRDHEKEIEELCLKITKTDKDEEKSLFAYELILIRSKVKKESITDLINSKQEILDFTKNRKIVEGKESKYAGLLENNKTTNLALEACLEDIADFHLMGIEEYSKLNLEERFNYIKHLSKILENLDSKVDLILKAQRDFMDGMLKEELGIDRFLAVALGDKD